MPPSEPPSASKPKRRVARKAKPQPPSSEALKGRAYGSRPARALPKPPNPRAVRSVRRAAQSAPPGSLASTPGITSRQNPPATKPQTATQRAKSEEFQHVSQGRAVEKQAKSQERRVYTQLPLANRRHLLQSAKLFQSAPGMEPNAYGKAALQVHHERHAKDVQDKKQFGELPRIAQKDLGAAAQKYGEGLPKDTKAGRKALNTIMDPAFTAGSDKPSTHTPGTRLGEPDKKGARGVFDADGKRVGFVAKYTGYKGQKGGIADLVSPRSAIIHAGPVATAGLKAAHAPKIVANIPADAAELAVTTPSSIVKLAATTATHPKKVPGMLAAPYKELAKHPGKFATEHPVSTALMLAPIAKVPGHAAGRIARRAGKQTLARPSATLPGSVLKKPRTGNRGIVTRAVQSHRDTKRGSPTMTAADVQKRTDVFYDFGKQHVARVATSAGKSFKDRPKTKAMSKTERKAAGAEHIQGARGGGQHQVARRFAEEFGAPHVVERPSAPMPRGPRGETPDQFSARAQAHRASLPPGKIVVPKDVTKGALHDSRADAQTIADHLNAQGTQIARGRHGVNDAPRRNTQVPLEYKVQDAGHGQFAVVPEVAAARLTKQKAVGSSQAPGAKYLRTAGRSFRTAVIPTSVRWLAGQAGEAGLRAAVGRAGPFDFAREAKVVRKMNKEKPGSGAEFRARMTGGQFDITGTAREFSEGKSLADEFKGTALEDVAHGLTKAGATRPAKVARAGFKAYTHVVYNVVNSTIEHGARRAMTGQVIKQGPLMERHIVGLTDKAIADAAKGLKHTENQVKAGEALDRMYGQYQKFSPEKREHLLHTTPFYPWYRNVVTFLTKTLPVDHPVTTALLADLDAATEDWRKANGLSLREGGHRPGFMLGGYPAGGDRVTRYGRYMPFAPGDVYGSVADLVTPQYAGTKAIMKGVDWKGGKIKGSIPLNAIEALAEAHVPFYGMAGRLTGIPGHYIKKTGEPSVFQGKKLGPALRKEFNPVEPTGKAAPKSSDKGTSLKAVKIKPVKVKPVKIRPVRAG